MKHVDVVVVGAGPAGGHCARLLAKSGCTVLLVERYKDFTRNSFSSAGTPLETLERFQLPETVVGSFWNQLVIVTSNQRGAWESERSLGCVLDFTQLRQFLADEVTAFGGEVWLGCRYLSHVQQDGEVVVRLKNHLLAEEISVRTRVLVDATGPNRSVMYEKEQDKPKFVSGTGTEYLIEVNESAYQACANALTFFLGYQWMPKGYSWIFPMQPNTLKVGAGLINERHHIVDRVEPLKHYIQLIIKEYIKPDFYTVLDVHGGTVKYSMGLHDRYYCGETVIAIGDAVSTINFLGGEGIRHGMLSAEVACKHILARLQEPQRFKDDGFKDYERELQAIFLNKWKISERLGMKKYLEDADELVDKVVTYLAPMRLEDVVDILFYYKFERASKGMINYLIAKLQTFFRQMVHRIRRKSSRFK